MKTDLVATSQSQGLDKYNFIPLDLSWEQGYAVHRIGLNTLEVTEVTRNDLLRAMDEKRKYIQIGEITVMLNSISSIEPLPKKRGSINDLRYFGKPSEPSQLGEE